MSVRREDANPPYDWLRQHYESLKPQRVGVLIPIDGGREKFGFIVAIEADRTFVRVSDGTVAVPRTVIEKAFRTVGHVASSDRARLAERYARWMEAAHTEEAKRKHLAAEAAKVEQQQLARQRIRAEAEDVLRRAASDWINAHPLRYPYELTPQDHALCRAWLSHENSASDEKHKEHQMARLLSARVAEKAVGRFFQELGKRVVDVSLTQLCHGEADWKRCDLRVGNRNREIDVKNARRSRNSRKGYSQWIVPKFKVDQDRRDVFIFGVLSPYLSLDRFAKPSEYSGPQDEITLLGETNWKTVARLKSLIEEGGFVTCDFSVGEQSSHFLPPWAFGFPDELYRHRESARQDFGRLKEKFGPDVELVESRLLPLYLASGDPSPVVNYHSTDDPMDDFCQTMAERVEAHGLTLSVVFTTVLAHFLKAASRSDWGNGSFSPASYCVIFPRIADRLIKTQPLFVFDPLETCDGLISALCSLWESRAFEPREFDAYRLSGFGILRGRRVSDRKFWTLVAYCGGTTERGAPCGYEPLVLGDCVWCDRCQHLACPKCEFCAPHCPGRDERRARAAAAGETPGNINGVLESENQPF